MTKKELLEAINAKKQEVKDFVSQDKLEEATSAKEELKQLQSKFDLIKDLDGDDGMQKIKDDDKDGKAKAVGGATDVVKEFAAAARAGFRVSNAMTTGMREGSDPDGGYVVPEDIQTKINQYKSAESSLESLITVEPVTTNKGSRTYEKKSEMTGFEDIEEGGSLEEMDTPQFERIKYEIQDRGGWLPLTNDLLSDSDQNITAYITQWIARKSNATSNSKIVNLFATQEVKEIETMDEIKRAFIVTLGAAYRDGASLLTNESGIFFLSTLKDKNGRDLLNPDPKDVMQMYLSVGPLRIPIRETTDSILKPDVKQAGKMKIPMICADFKEAFKKYDRQRTELMSSNVAVAGSLNAFTQNLTLVRAIERNDYKVIDADAFVNLSMVVDDSTVTGE